MPILGYVADLASALIWALAAVAYRPLIISHGSLRVNLVRLTYAALAALGPAVYLGLARPLGDLYAAASGVITLSVGDTLYLMAIGAAGVSVAAPTAYSYVVMSQFVAIALGEPLSIYRLIAAGLTVVGVYLVFKGKGGTRRARGILYAIGTAGAWTAGQALIGLSYSVGLSPISIAFMRAASAALAVTTVAAIGLGPSQLPPSFSALSRTYLPLVAAADLALGSALFAYAIGVVGFAPAVIVNSATPLFAQASAWALGAESPGPSEFAGAALIALSVALTVL